MNDTTRSPAELELDIQRTRARMTENVDALTWKLSPEHLKARARHKLHETQEAVVEKVRHTAHEVGDQARQAGSDLFGTLKENPIPAAMIGAGLAWLIIGSRRHADERDSYGRYYTPEAYLPADTAVTGTASAHRVGGTAGGGIYSAEPAGYAGATSTGSEEESHGLRDRAAEVRDRVGEKTSHARERIGETAASARDTVREKAHAASDRASHAFDSARERAGELRHGAADRARRTRGWAERQMEENPLVVGAAVLAAGAVVGSLVPTTRKEDELIGRKRDELMDRARGTFREAREVVGATARETVASAKEELSAQRETLRSTADDLASEAKTSARKVAHDAKETARAEAEERKLV